MAREKRKPKKRFKGAEQKDSDVEESCENPDPETEEFFYDDVDKFHSNREKILLEKLGETSDEESVGFEEVEEVLSLDAESDDYDENLDEEFNDVISESDNDAEKGIPSEKAWGKKKKVYYDRDQHKPRDLDSEEEEAMEKEEEEEVMMLQRTMADRLDENDFDIEEFEMPKSEEIEQKSKLDDNMKKLEQEKIVMDLSNLSKDEKIKLLAKNSPEMFELIEDFKEKLAEVTGTLYPLVKMARDGIIENSKGVEYLEMKHQLIMNYLVNIYFYLLLKAHQAPVKNHPVIERLVEYRELLQQLKPLDSQLKEDIHDFLERREKLVDANDEVISMDEIISKGQKKNKEKKVHFSDAEPKRKPNISSPSVCQKRKVVEDLDPLSYYESIRDIKKKKKDERRKMYELSVNAKENDVIIEDDEDPDGKRGITYQISKNKGLTPKRKKDVRNPRLKHRKKFVKAKIRRKSQINPVVKEISRYGGEPTGIKSHLTRSIKIK